MVHSPFHAQGNGQVERVNWSMKTLLRFHIEQDSHWDAKLPQCLMAYRASPQETTGFSSFQLIHDQEMRLPIDNWCHSTQEAIRPGAHYIMLREVLRRDQEKARVRSIKEKSKQKRNFDCSANPCEFKTGDAVWLYRPT